jgi:hypothetical protein
VGKVEINLFVMEVTKEVNLAPRSLPQIRQKPHTYAAVKRLQTVLFVMALITI